MRGGHKEGWAPKNWCFWIVVLEKTLESRLDSKEIKLVNPKGNQPWIFIRRTDAEAEALILWPLDVKSWFTGKDPDAGKDWEEEKGMTEAEMVGWHHRLNGHEFIQTLVDNEGWGSQVCCSSWGGRVGHDWAMEQITICWWWSAFLMHRRSCLLIKMTGPSSKNYDVLFLYQLILLFIYIYEHHYP